MDNLPKDPPDDNGNSPTPPPFGSDFNQHPHPTDPNPDSAAESEVHSEVAKHQPRDSHGRFIPEHEQNPTSAQQVQAPLNSPNTPNPSVPSTPQVIHNNSTGNSGGNDKDDEPLVQGGFKITNPFSDFFNWIKKLIKNEGINIKIKPLTAIAIAVALTGGGGIIGYLFPHSSPILHRAVVYQGNIQKTPNGYYLTLPNSDLYTLKPKSNINLNFVPEGQALVKGNLTREDYVIEVSEIVPLNSTN